MARREKMTVDEYITGREDMTVLTVVESELGWEIILRLDGSYADEETAREVLKLIGKTLRLPVV